jgi:hypothetical protein
VLTRRYTRSTFGGAMAALLFAVHPVHIEATAWPSAQPDLLCTGFILLSMWFLEQYLEGAGRWRRVGLAAAVSAFFLALLSKETAAVFPAVVLVRVLIVRGDQRAMRVARVAAAYAAAMAGYLIVRFIMLGKHWLGGYGIDLSPSEALLSQTPMRLVGQLLFPVHITLLKPVSPYLWLAAIVLMAVGVLWWLNGTVFVPGKRLLFYASYLLAPMVPLAVARLPIGEELSASRYAYIPSIGLALLFGAVCAGRPGGWHRGRAAGAAILCVMAALSFWYVEPWREAARLRDKILAEGVRVVRSLPDSPPPSTVFFRGIPVAYHGAAVFVTGCNAAVLSARLGGSVSVQDVGPTSADLDVMVSTELAPGEYVVAWDADSERMVVERSGGSEVTQPRAEVQP